MLIKQERLNENFYLITRRVSRKLFKLANELTNRDNKNFKQQSVEVDDCITELWDTLFNMGLSQSFSERFLANGFEIQRKFRRVFDTLKEARDEFDNYIDSNKDDEFSDIGHETTYDLQLNQTLAIADIMDEINKMLPEGLRYQVTNK